MMADVMIRHLLFFLSLIVAAEAAPCFDRVFGSHMVLPCGRPVTISGTKAHPGRMVEVSYGDLRVSAKADARGLWKVQLPPMAADGTPRTLVAAQNGEVSTLDNVVTGVVWLASGQSNMLWRLNQSTTGGSDIPLADNPELRIYNLVPQVHTGASAYGAEDMQRLTPERFYQGEWRVSSPDAAAPCSAVAYYFANQLQRILKIPVGIIHVSLGGSEMAAWIPPSVIDSNPFYRSCRGNKWLDSPLVSPWVRGRARQNIGSMTGSGTPAHPFKPGFLYQAGIDWVTRMPVSGVIWYQGESDAEIDDPAQHAHLLRDLIGSWRKSFRDHSLPFAMVGLPRINDTTPLRAGWPEFREVQQQVAAAMPGVCCVTTIDLGSTNADVHPPDKKPVGERLAAAVLHEYYGRPDFAAHGPSFTGATEAKNAMRVIFRDAVGLRTVDGKEPAGFEIAGSDRKYVPATAVLDEKGQVLVSSPRVSKPKYVRYCWAPFATPNLVNKDGLPAVPFRSGR